MFKWIVGILCLLLPLSVGAELYKVIAADGSVIYTDMQPNPDAKEHRLGKINTVGNPEYNMDKVNMRLQYVDEGGAMIVAGTVNGVAMRFVVDTGATLVVIPPQIAEKAGLLQGEKDMVTAQTANGAVQVIKTRIDMIVIDKVSRSDVEATVQAIMPDEPDLGLLGMSFFGKYKMTIDHEKQEILLEKK